MAALLLVPVKPLFPKEHMTLVWMGSGLHEAHHKWTEAQHLAFLVNKQAYAACSDDTLPPISLTIHEDNTYQNFGGVMVAVGDISYALKPFVEIAKMIGLDGRKGWPELWRPHISGQPNCWRKPGEVVMFRHATVE